MPDVNDLVAKYDELAKISSQLSRVVDGINANSPQIDGGTNKAHDNTNPRQCAGVVCS